jgi:hypothetical protein
MAPHPRREDFAAGIGGCLWPRNPEPFSRAVGNPLMAVRSAHAGTVRRPYLPYKLAPAAQLKPVPMQMGLSSNMADLLLEGSCAQFGSHEDARTALCREHDSDYSGNFRRRSVFASVLVLRGFLDAIDDEHIDGRLGRFQFQA